MMALIVLIWLGFQGLAICALGGMLDMGFGTGDAMAIAVVLVTAGAMVTRAIYRKTCGIETAADVTAHRVSAYPQTSQI